MPTYSYECPACRHRFDRFQSMSEAPVKVCPSCGKRSVRRMIGAGSGIIFRGSGFYQTDYRSESYKARAKADAESVKPAATDSATKSSTTKSSTDAKTS